MLSCVVNTHHAHFSGGFFCICYIFTMIFLLSDRNSGGLAWYQARFLEPPLRCLLFSPYCMTFLIFTAIR